MSIKFHKEGFFTRQFTPGSAVTAGEPIALGGGIIGVAKTDISANTVGEFYIRGLFNVTKATGFAITQGGTVLYDTSAQQLVGTYNSNCIMLGSAVEAMASGATSGKVSLNNDNIIGITTPGLANTFETQNGTAPALATNGVSYLDGTSNTVSATLANGALIGQEKVVVATNVTNAVTLSVTTHETSSPEVFTFVNIGDSVRLMWNGLAWVTVDVTPEPTHV